MEQQELDQQRLKETAIDLVTSPLFLRLFELRQPQQKPTKLKRFLIWLSYFDSFFIGLTLGLVIALAFDAFMMIEFSRLVSATIEQNCGAK